MNSPGHFWCEFCDEPAFGADCETCHRPARWVQAQLAVGSWQLAVKQRRPVSRERGRELFAQIYQTLGMSR